MHDYTPALQQSIDLKNLFTKSLSYICEIEKEEEALKAKDIKTRTRFDTVYTAFKEGGAGLSPFNDCFKRLHEVQEEKRALEHKIQSQHKLIFSEFVDILGIPCIDKWLQKQQDLSTTQHSSDGTSSGTTADHAEALSTCDTAMLCSRSPDGLLPVGCHETSTASRNYDPNLSDIEGTTEKNAHPSGHPSGSPEPIPVILCEKRKLSSTIPGSKRPRANEPLCRITETKSIHFRQLYQERKDPRKYTIIGYAERWYILHCDKHKLCFATKDPIRGASKHISSVHEVSPANYQTTIETSGIEVLNCTPDLASLYNDVSVHENIDPKPGDVYMTRWDKNEPFYAILVLPWRMHDQNGNLIVEDISLFNDIPECYEYNQRNHTVQWAPDYQQGGIYDRGRKYPVMFFDEKYASTNCHVAWLPLYQFQEYNSSDTDVYDKSVVDEFIRSTGTVSTIGDKSVGSANRAICRFRK
ncbi:hypothetical protein FOQG_14792 [Fusarium oxysporum f. sp. raphani 54005]|uniref:Uncharacterized protein n=2 Tax=Fusarium oxysporum f. sp. raphani TaxID=96318 RepID=X0BQL3_FUSOX|nr:hypothetical protein FOQG_14792 [Fusarium oxysporum f. sp. raphani 54005]KAG7407978.1 hypothetical protein Forpi1262_v018088 [Fusarium oxysporum f. sp. raphani]